MALRTGDMVLVHVTTFKGRHKIQNRWENREYVVERQSYPNLPVYVACPIDREGCSQTLHRNYLFPISNNLEQAECENPVEGVGPIDELTSVSQAGNVLPANQPNESQPESLPNTAPEQCELVEPELTGSTSPDTMNDGLKAEDTTPVSLWKRSRKMRKQLPLRYQNFALWQNAPPGTFDWWVGLCICLYTLVMP